MYKVDEYVVHVSGGICQIKSIGPITIPGADKNKQYYFLTSLKTAGSKVYVPVDNDLAMRPINTEDDINKLVQDFPSISETVIEDEKHREIVYKDIIKGCNLYELAGLIKNIHVRRVKRLNEGKKPTATDEKYYKVVEDNFISEIAFVLGKSKLEMKDWLTDALTNA